MGDKSPKTLEKLLRQQAQAREQTESDRLRRHSSNIGTLGLIEKRIVPINRENIKP